MNKELLKELYVKACGYFPPCSYGLKNFKCPYDYDDESCAQNETQEIPCCFSILLSQIESED